MAETTTHAGTTAEPAAETCCGSCEPVGASRRAVLRAAGVGGAVAAVGLAAAACSTSSSGTASDPVPASAAGGGSAGSGSGSGSSGTVLAATSDVPVDGGKIIASPAVVVTQPSAGTYKAFSSTCTHQGCTVSSVADNQIHCPCHGSVFSATDGSVVTGPASSPLPSVSVTVSGGNIVTA